MAEDWDLFAVVRSCTTSSTTTAAANSSTMNDIDLPIGNDMGNGNKGVRREEEVSPLACLASLRFEEEDDPFSFPYLSSQSQSQSQFQSQSQTLEVRKIGSGCLQDSYKPFLAQADPTTTVTTNRGIDPTSCSSTSLLLLPNPAGVGGGSNGQHHQYHHQHQQQMQEQPTTASIGISPPLTPTTTSATHSTFAFTPSGSHHQHVPVQQQQPQVPQQRADVLPLRNMQSQAPRSRKRKNQQKRTVCHVTADNLSSDPWAWRKYGQKPIKGSPYPRNYYRCSSSKGCSARKQVERSNLDPNVFIVTYTGDHTHPRPTHRNSLAGSTRNKLPGGSASLQIQDPAATGKDSASCSSPLSAATLSPTTPVSSGAAQLHNPGEEESIDMALETGPDGESDEADEDDDDLLIPNVHVDEDLFKGLEEFVGGAGAAGTSGTTTTTTTTNGLGRKPPFGDNFSSWGTGSSAAAGAAAGGGC